MTPSVSASSPTPGAFCAIADAAGRLARARHTLADGENELAIALQQILAERDEDAPAAENGDEEEPPASLAGWRAGRAAPPPFAPEPDPARAVSVASTTRNVTAHHVL